MRLICKAYESIFGQPAQYVSAQRTIAELLLVMPSRALNHAWQHTTKALLLLYQWLVRMALHIAAQAAVAHLLSTRHSRLHFCSPFIISCEPAW